MDTDAGITSESHAVSLSIRGRMLATNSRLSLLSVLCALGGGIATVATGGSTVVGCVLTAAGILSLHEDAGIMSESDAVSLSSRRRALLRRSLLSALIPLGGGIATIATGGPMFVGCVLIAVGVPSVVQCTILLLLPPEELLAIPGSFFWLLAPSDLRSNSPASQTEVRAKPLTRITDSFGSNSGVWDRDLDGVAKQPMGGAINLRVRRLRQHAPPG